MIRGVSLAKCHSVNELMPNWQFRNKLGIIARSSQAKTKIDTQSIASCGVLRQMYVGNLRSAEAKRSMKVRAPCSDDALFEAQLTTIGGDELRKIWVAKHQHETYVYSLQMIGTKRYEESTS